MIMLHRLQSLNFRAERNLSNHLNEILCFTFVHYTYSLSELPEGTRVARIKTPGYCLLTQGLPPLPIITCSPLGFLSSELAGCQAYTTKKPALPHPHLFSWFLFTLKVKTIYFGIFISS